MSKKPNSIDWQACIQLANNNEAIAGELLMMFVNDLPSVVENFSTTLKNKNFESLEAQAHKLHGATCYVGVPDLKRLVASFEKAMKDPMQHHVDIAQSHLTPIIQECNQIIEDYQSHFSNLNQDTKDANEC